MTLALSTSTPFAAVALFDGAQLVTRNCKESRRAASSAIIEMRELLPTAEISRIVVDVGPGSFTGVRVGVTMAKMWAEIEGLPLFGVESFDLFGSGPVAIPSKRGEVFLRIPGHPSQTIGVGEAEKIDGVKFVNEVEMNSILTVLPLDRIFESDPLGLMPSYVGEPNISVAKQAHIMGETFGGRGDV
ncbi:tRNA (adenosine(37)-N6)-threonylcarbamoyltransferase complex dimerization subunit type 1 TsaB [Armatimonadetes bacterium Uphvl-Ar1]|nr:tRNA (adenosine(37)-N6)-threonylcarbamoyltransferase complex dimerization subunit type 1 TsaB [Armatimonadetes bacterium Uphvl-Ar1]